jgi:hypothetical protein
MKVLNLVFDNFDLIDQNIKDIANLFNDKPNNELPTIYIGWLNAKKHFPNIKPSKYKIDDKNYFVFSPHEKRNEYEKHIYKIIKEIHLDYCKYTNIINLDPIINHHTEEYLIEFLNNLEYYEIFIKNNDIYLYNDNNIYYLDLSLLEYLEMFKVIDFFTNNFITQDSFDKMNIKDNIGYIETYYLPYIKNKLEWNKKEK